MERAELIVDDSSAFSRTAAVLAAYTQAPAVLHTLRLATVQQLRLSTPVLVASTRLFRSPLALFTGILTVAGRLDLVGKTPVQRAQVSSWLELSRTLPRDQFLTRLEGHMGGREFVVAQQLTVADFVAFAAVEGTGSKHLLTWMSCMRSIPEMTGFMHFSQTHKPSAQSNSTQVQDKKPQEQTPKPPNPPSIDPLIPLNLCVGRITRIWKHPSKDRLYCQEVDIGTETRTIASGLVGLVAEPALLNSLVVVLTNLKPRRMGDFLSQGMLLCASWEGTVEPLRPPVGAKPGDVVSIAGVQSAPLPELPPKKTYWEQASERMVISPAGEVTYKDQPLQTAAGPVLVPTLRKGKIS